MRHGDDMEGRNESERRFAAVYKQASSLKILFIVLCIIGVIVAAVFSATVGSYPIGAGQVYEILWIAVSGGVQPDPTVAHIVIDLRLPRILGAIVCGAALALCGTAMQSMMKNPLADPYTMGISSGAGFGAALAIIMGVELFSGGGTILNAFVFAVIPAMIILFLSKFRKATPTMMILCGTSLMYLFNALTQLFMLIADPDDMSTVYQWMVGSLDGLDFSELGVVFLITVAGFLYIQTYSNQLNVMGAGDDSAKSMGVDVERRRLVMLLMITLVAASVVSFTGIIGFVGLVAPHIARYIVGSDNRFLVPASAVFGALLLLVSDILAKVIAAPLMLPVGVITSCIGGPLFMFLILRTNKEVWT